MLGAGAVHAFIMPLPTFDIPATSKAASVVDAAKSALDIATTMQETMEEMQAMVDNGMLALLQQVPLPSGWIGDAAREAIANGGVPYNTLASGLLDVSNLPEQERALIGKGMQGISAGTSPWQIAMNLGIETAGEQLDATDRATLDGFTSFAQASGPDGRFAAVAQLGALHGAGLADSLDWEAPEWASDAVDAAREVGHEGAAAWSEISADTPPWMRSMVMAHAADPVRTALGAVTDRVHPAILERSIGPELRATLAQGARQAPPRASEMMIAGVRTAATALEDEHPEPGIADETAALREQVRARHPGAPMDTRRSHHASVDVNPLIDHATDAGVFDGHVHMRDADTLGASSDTHRDRTVIDQTALRGGASAVLAAASSRNIEDGFVSAMDAIAPLTMHRGAGAGRIDAIVESHGAWITEAVNETVDTAQALGGLAGELEVFGLTSAASRAAQAAQRLLPAGAAARARRACALLDRLGEAPETVCRWRENRSAPGRLTTTAIEGGARRIDRLALAFSEGASYLQWTTAPERLTSAVRAGIGHLSEHWREVAIEATARAETGCLTTTQTEMEPGPGPRPGGPARRCPGGLEISRNVPCPVGTPRPGSTTPRATPVDALYAAGSAGDHWGGGHNRVAQIEKMRETFAMTAGIDALAHAASATQATTMRRAQAREMSSRLEACEDLLCELRIQSDVLRLEAEEATVLAHLALTSLDLEIAAAITEHDPVRE